MVAIAIVVGAFVLVALFCALIFGMFKLSGEADERAEECETWIREHPEEFRRELERLNTKSGCPCADALEFAAELDRKYGAREG